MTRRRQLATEQCDRLREANEAVSRISIQQETVRSQLSLVDKLSEGWKRVHEFNHLAELFRPSE